MIFLNVLLWILLAWNQLGINTVKGQCDSEGYFYCNIRIANMTTDGGARLRKAFENGKAVQIEKMIVSISPSGPLLQRFTNMIYSLIYAVYREVAFHIPDDNTIGDINIATAPALRTVVAGSNTSLRYLWISQCPMDRLSSTIYKLTRLESLTITQCKLAVLRLDMLVENQSLEKLNLAFNRITQLIPITSLPKKMLTVKSLVLLNNQLQRLDLAIFVFMPKLQFLDVQKNLIVTLDASAAVALPMLATVGLTDNKITSIDLRNLTLPSLQNIELGQNALQRMPALPKSLPRVNYLALHRNNLTQLDLSYFRSYTNLHSILLSYNRIAAVRTSFPVQLAVQYLDLNNNQITTFNMTGLGMPNITSLYLDNNRLNAIPPVFDRYPKARLMMNGNPLKCNTLLPFKDKLKDFQLIKDLISVTMNCTTESSFLLDDTKKVCCDN